VRDLRDSWKMDRMETACQLQTHRAEERHWWYRGRRRVLHRVIARLRLRSTARILDAGCGSGRNMVELARYGSVTGVELSPLAIDAARSRRVGEVFAGSVSEMDLPDHSFDLAVCLDVIEHLPDDRAALSELRRVVEPGGALIVTVPAYQWLWSAHDVANEHHRRYSRHALLAAASDAHWRCERVTHFNSFLLPLAIAARLLERQRAGRARAARARPDLWVPPAPLNRLMELPLDLEALLIGAGARIPCGLSLLAVLR
jgi:SAM-dependent methyltransferase